MQHNHASSHTMVMQARSRACLECHKPAPNRYRRDTLVRCATMQNHAMRPPHDARIAGVPADLRCVRRCLRAHGKRRSADAALQCSATISALPNHIWQRWRFDAVMKHLFPMSFVIVWYDRQLCDMYMRTMCVQRVNQRKNTTITGRNNDGIACASGVLVHSLAL